MGIFGKARKELEPKYDDDAYWQRRWEEKLKNKDIVKRFVVCFGVGNYEDFCGIKEITGFYEELKDPIIHIVFYQIDFDNSRSLRGYDASHCFETRKEAQEAYNKMVLKYTVPLEIRLAALNAACLM